MCGTVLKQIAEGMYARNLIYKNVGLPVDSIHHSPHIKNGLKEHSLFAMDRLKVQYKDSTKGIWISARNTDDKIIIRDNPVEKEVVPNVRGMGAKDAIYALESTGLRVNLSGKGKVYAQSIEPGSSVGKGKTISIQLR